MHTRCVPMLRYDRTYKLMLKIKSVSLLKYKTLLFTEISFLE